MMMVMMMMVVMDGGGGRGNGDSGNDSGDDGEGVYLSNNRSIDLIAVTSRTGEQRVAIALSKTQKAH